MARKFASHDYESSMLAYHARIGSGGAMESIHALHVLGMSTTAFMKSHPESVVEGLFQLVLNTSLYIIAVQMKQNEPFQPLRYLIYVAKSLGAQIERKAKKPVPNLCSQDSSATS